MIPRFVPLALLLFAGIATAGDDWLEQASRAVRTTNYRGVLVYLRGGDIDTLKIVHRYRDGEERERLVSLTGEPREVLRDGAMVTSVLPARGVVMVAEHRRKGILSNFGRYSTERLDKLYTFHDLGRRRLADRPCRVILLRPRDRYRYGYRLTIDERTHLPLKLDLLSGRRVLEQLMFTHVEFPETIPDGELQPSYETEGYRWIRHRPMEGERRNAGVWRIVDTPEGFKLAEEGLRRVEGGVARQLLFTDGIATVSAFIASPGRGRGFTGITTMGAVNAYGRRAGNYQITVVGEVPEATVRYIAEHLERRVETAVED